MCVCVCVHWSEKVRWGVEDMGHYDEKTWKRVVPLLVEKLDREELERFKKLRMYVYGPGRRPR